MSEGPRTMRETPPQPRYLEVLEADRPFIEAENSAMMGALQRFFDCRAKP